MKSWDVRGLVVLGIYLAASLAGRVMTGHSVVNHLVLLPLYLGAIHVWTRRDAPLEPLPRSRRDPIILGVVTLAIVAPAIWFALHPGPVPLSTSPPDPRVAIVNVAINAVQSTIVLTVPALALWWFARLPTATLRPRFMLLAAALVASGIGFALAISAETWLVIAPAYALPLFALHLFVNGLPEELLFRGVVLQRLLAITRSPLIAIVVSSAMFDSAHWAIALSRGQPALDVFAYGFGALPTGLVWGYLFYRTRSVWPGILWHTSFTILGVLFV